MPAKKNHKTGKAERARKKPFYKSPWLALIPVAALVGAVYYFSLDYEPPAPLPPPPASALYRQTNQPIENRVSDLLSHMTLEEKISQMAMVDKNSVPAPEEISRYGLGAVLSGAGVKPADNTASGWLEMVESFKHQAEQTRLGIPLLFGVDATHGHANVPGATVFPHAIGLGAANDETLVRNIAAATSAELAATGINWNFSPMLDAPEDIRWGRTYEAFSSDPAINSKLGAAYVAGAQATLPNGRRNLASAKHFMGLGSMRWGESNNKDFSIDQGRIPADDTALTTKYLPPFNAVVQAGVATVMVGLTEYGDTRIIDNKSLVTDKLKTGMNFDGIVVSDWYGMYEFSGVSRYQANIKAINAGTDMAMLPFDYKTFISDVRDAVARGEIARERIDDAVARILTQKFKAGLFDKPQVAELGSVGSAEHRALARKAVAASAVLLKNNDSILPLKKSGDKLLVAGSGADNVGRQAGAWTVEWQGIDGNWLPGATSILSGIARAAGPSSTIVYEKDGNFPAGTKAAVGLAIVSEKPYAEGWGDNENPALDKADVQAIERLHAAAESVVIVTVTGRPLFMTDHITKADAVLAAWLPGSEGAGVADVLFGDTPFTGTLPVAWPSNTAQLPVLSSGETADGSQPLFPRGYSLRSTAQ